MFSQPIDLHQPAVRNNEMAFALQFPIEKIKLKRFLTFHYWFFISTVCFAINDAKSENWTITKDVVDSRVNLSRFEKRKITCIAAIAAAGCREWLEIGCVVLVLIWKPRQHDANRCVFLCGFSSLTQENLLQYDNDSLSLFLFSSENGMEADGVTEEERQENRPTRARQEEGERVRSFHQSEVKEKRKKEAGKKGGYTEVRCERVGVQNRRETECWRKESREGDRPLETSDWNTSHCLLQSFNKHGKRRKKATNSFKVSFQSLFGKTFLYHFTKVKSGVKRWVSRTVQRQWCDIISFPSRVIPLMLLE